jgi:hypothetical protein
MMYLSVFDLFRPHRFTRKGQLWFLLQEDAKFDSLDFLHAAPSGFRLKKHWVVGESGGQERPREGPLLPLVAGSHH